MSWAACRPSTLLVPCCPDQDCGPVPYPHRRCLPVRRSFPTCSAYQFRRLRSPQENPSGRAGAGPGLPEVPALGGGSLDDPTWGCILHWSLAGSWGRSRSIGGVWCRRRPSGFTFSPPPTRPNECTTVSSGGHAGRWTLVPRAPRHPCPLRVLSYSSSSTSTWPAAIFMSPAHEDGSGPSEP